MIILYVGLGTYVEKTGLEEIDKEFLHYLQGGAFVFIHLKWAVYDELGKTLK